MKLDGRRRGLRGLRPPRGAQDRDDAVSVERGHRRRCSPAGARSSRRAPSRSAGRWASTCPRSSRSSASTRPLAGFLTTDSRSMRASVAGTTYPVVVESEVAVELGDDGRSIVALLPALELADPPDLDLESSRSSPATSFTAPSRSARAWRPPTPGAGPHPRERRGAALGEAGGRRLGGDGRGGRPPASRPPARSSGRASASSPACSPRRTRPSRATRCGSSSTRWGAWSSAFRSISGMSTATALPDALSDAARSFASGPHRFVIGGERPEAADGRTFETLDPCHRPRRSRTCPTRRGGRGPRRARRARGVRGQALVGHRRRRAHAGDAGLRRRGGRARRRARRAGVARQRQAGEDGAPRGRAAHGRAPALLRGLAHADQRRGAAGRPAEHALLHPQGAGGRGGPDHPVELPAADGGVEGGPGAGGRLHDRAEARRADAAHRAPARRARARGGPPRGRAERDHRRRRDRARRWSTTPASTRSPSPARRRWAARSARRRAARSSG